MDNNFFEPQKNMFGQQKTINVPSADAQAGQAAFMTKVYGWMAGALAITGFIAYFIGQWIIGMMDTAGGAQTLAKYQPVMWVAIIAEFGLVIWLSARIQKMAYTTAMLAFIAYSALNGVTMSFIFAAYTMSSIASTFFITAGTFGIMSLYGYMTKTDLTKIGKVLFMFLIGIVIASVVNIFLKSSGLEYLITYLGVAVFVGLTAYDTQKIKNFYYQVNGDEVTLKKIGIFGALILYLDFINLFLFLLRLFGNSRN